jgi:hypothetical protein
MIRKMQILFIIYSAVEKAAFRSGGSFYAVLSSLSYSRETHPPGSDSHGCITLHFAKNRNEHRAMPLKSTLPTAVIRSIDLFDPLCFFMLSWA